MWLIILLFLSIVFIIISTSILKWHPFLSLIIVAFGFGIFSGTLSVNEVVEAVNTGFGNTIGYIGIVILAGSIIGKFLEKSGGAFKLASGALKVVGKKNMPLAMSIVGYIVSIPVFCDSAFIVLSPLSKALSRKTKISFAVLAMALSLGLYVTHSLIPPTPGPVAAAGILEADLGLVILLGLPVSFVGLIIGWLFAIKIASKYKIEQDTVSEEPELEISKEKGPSLLKSLLPIFIPIILIILRSINELPSVPFGSGSLSTIISFVGQPSVALLIGVGLSFLLPIKLKKEMLSTTGWLGQGVIAAASIIIVTGSGGAFGQVLQASGIAEVVRDNLSGAQSLGIFLPIIIAASLKIAQGSGTVSIITSASLMAPLIPSLGLDTTMARALVVVAIGSGAMIASHANDSYFWVVTQMSGMNVNQGYRLQTIGTFVVGICSAIAVWIISLWIL
ncbi:MAG: GntP family permease [Mariniphaga sp.]|nr:GntP family permease [Mariniphaga sp.]